MALVIADLASAINDAIAARDKDGNLSAPTNEMTKYASAVVKTFQAGIVNHLSGTVVGITTAGSPLSNGAALGGLVTGLLPTTWLAETQAGFPTATGLAADASGSTSYLTSSTLVNFAPGKIEGTCTSTPTSPGPLVNGKGEGGTVTGLAGAAWAAAVMPPGADPTLTQAIYNAISSYLMANTEAAYAPSSVTGLCPPASGPLGLGTGLIGTLT